MNREVRATLGLVLLSSAQLAAQVSNQSFQVTPDVARATVGDSVTLRFRIRLDERDLLFDTVPRPIEPLANGVRVLSVEKMYRTPDRIFHGQARLAFYRPGRQAVPVFGVPFMRAVKGVQRATLASDSAFVDVIPLLPAGNPALKDIRELEPSARRPGALLAGGALLLTVLLILAHRQWRRRVFRQRVPLPANQPVVAPTADPYVMALQALERVEREHWPSHGEVAQHYQAVADVLRDYLEAAEGVPARERTTGEMLWALPPHLSGSGLRERLRELLDDADLVKFAQVRPDKAAARLFLERSRSLLSHWHEAQAPMEEAVDALR